MFNVQRLAVNNLGRIGLNNRIIWAESCSFCRLSSLLFFASFSLLLVKFAKVRYNIEATVKGGLDPGSDWPTIPLVVLAKR